MPKQLLIEISPGELLDRITILMVKQEQLPSSQDNIVITKELAKLNSLRIANGIPFSNKLLIINRNTFVANEAVCLGIRESKMEAHFRRAVIVAFEENAKRALIKKEINKFCSYTTSTEVKTSGVLEILKKKER